MRSLGGVLVVSMGMSCFGACAGEDAAKSPPPDAAALVGAWEARIEKPFEDNDPEQFVYRIQKHENALTAVACTLDREDAVFEGPIESFACEDEATAVPVVETDDDFSITFTFENGDTTHDVRLVIDAWTGEDSCSGNAWVEQWAEFGATPFTAMRLDLE